MKGLHVILSAILLIAITAIAASILLNWVPTVFQSPQTSIENRTASCASAALKIQNVYLDINSSVGRITVFNSGFDDDSIISTNILSKTGRGSTNITQFPLTFLKGDQKTLEVNISGVITDCTNFSRAYVTTSCGISAEFGRFNENPTCVVQ